MLIRCFNNNYFDNTKSIAMIEIVKAINEIKTAQKQILTIIAYRSVICFKKSLLLLPNMAESLPNIKDKILKKSSIVSIIAQKRKI